MEHRLPEVDPLTLIDCITDGVARAWAERLRAICNQDILQAIQRGVETAMKATKK